MESNRLIFKYGKLKARLTIKQHWAPETGMRTQEENEFAFERKEMPYHIITDTIRPLGQEFKHKEIECNLLC